MQNINLWFEKPLVRIARLDRDWLFMFRTWPFGTSEYVPLEYGKEKELIKLILEKAPEYTSAQANNNIVMLLVKFREFI
jgi:hypothetical protein